MRKFKFTGVLLVIGAMVCSCQADAKRLENSKRSLLTEEESDSQSLSAQNYAYYSTIAKQILGQWRSTGASDYMTLIFTPEGKLFVLNSSNTAGGTSYKIHPTGQPRYLDLSDNGLTERLNFQFTDKGQLRIEFPRNEVKLFDKISDEARLPPNTSVFGLLENSRRMGKESEPRTYVGVMAKGQQAAFTEYSRFVYTNSEMGVGINSETANYSYKIVVIDPRRVVQLVGVSKQDDLRSYTSIVYVVKTSSGENTTEVISCRSNQPSKKLPSRPQIVNDTTVECPSGYSRW
ncbi:type IV pilin-like G/H family protein [Microcoleus sp. FACHB-831]|uniref:type IV pilin-like G/H family protein n=1 Tax=Microcoleus sp. FACHB-831 TaxID=2692827 RepID=UPI00168760F9|nr:type IV pilin-like G/H family protein [Microcoleus sp. FACHB-831]MBD1923573.1 type IV pilin-like G/H family protein [Microcoleus sp. FACHB-831]